MCYKLLKLAVITTALLLSGWAVAVPVPFADANKERAAAIKAEKKGDYEQPCCTTRIFWIPPKQTRLLA